MSDIKCLFAASEDGHALHACTIPDRTRPGASEAPEVLLLTSEYDYLIEVAVDGPRGYERFLRERLCRMPAIRHWRSDFVLRSLKNVQACPLLD